MKMYNLNETQISHKLKVNGVNTRVTVCLCFTPMTNFNLHCTSWKPCYVIKITVYSVDTVYNLNHSVSTSNNLYY